MFSKRLVTMITSRCSCQYVPQLNVPVALDAFAQCNLKFVKSLMAHWLNAGSLRSSDVEKEVFTEYYENDSKL